MKLKRYSLYFTKRKVTDDEFECFYQLLPNRRGQWVRFEDVAAVLGESRKTARNKPSGEICPRCDGSGIDGYDREYPPNPYICDMCKGAGKLPHVG